VSPAPFLDLAIDLALASIGSGGGPFGAVVVRGDRVLGRGQNRVVPHADPTAHAEVVAIRAAAAELRTHDLGGCEIFASCEPCPMCLGAIHWARLARVHYACLRSDAAAAGFDDEAFYSELARPPGERRIPMVAGGRERGLLVFREWLAREGRRSY
jgi:tRNA(Arg) A34 adenosine deaminase TadA